MTENQFTEFCADVIGLTKLEDDSGWEDSEGAVVSLDEWCPYTSLDALHLVEQRVVSPKTKGGLGLGGRYFDALSKSSRHDMDYIEKANAPESNAIEFTITIYTDYMAQLIASGIESRRAALIQIEDDILRATRKNSSL